MNDDLASKQAYLRENVLETGYDADEFMAFLQLRKGENGLDLNNWKMNELISVVEDFIKSKKVKIIYHQVKIKKKIMNLRMSKIFNQIII